MVLMLLEGASKRCAVMNILADGELTISVALRESRPTWQAVFNLLSRLPSYACANSMAQRFARSYRTGYNELRTVGILAQRGIWKAPRLRRAAAVDMHF